MLADLVGALHLVFAIDHDLTSAYASRLALDVSFTRPSITTRRIRELPSRSSRF
jgi:hypothetical protein